MATPPDAADPPSKHRPLPSVDMALLPHELRAVRLRQVTLVVLAALLLGAGLALTVARPWLAALVNPPPPSASDTPWPGEQGHVERTPAAAAPATTPPVCDPAQAAKSAAAGQELATAAGPDPSAEPSAVAPEPEESKALPAVAAENPHGQDMREALPALQPIPGRSVRRFGQARGFRGALLAAGISEKDADGLVAALEKLVEFRKAQPEDELVMERDASGHLLGFEYRASATERYRAERTAQGGFAATKVKVEIDHHRIAKGGYVSDSLGKALEALGVKTSVAGMFVEAFEGKIDFKKQARQGDSFKVLIDEDSVEGQPLGYGRIHALEYTSTRLGQLLAFWFESDTNEGDFYDENGRALHGGWLRTPLRYDHISSGYNLRRRHPILKRIMPHEGVDYSAPPGTVVWAAAEGVVSFTGQRGPNGNLVAIKHGGGYESYYAHLLRIAHGLKAGVKVKQRQPIGAVGSTGRSTGPHLHFALRHNGHMVDPLTQLNGPGKPLPEAQLPKFKRMVGQLKHDLSAIVLAPAPAPASGGAPAPSDGDPGEDFREDEIDL